MSNQIVVKMSCWKTAIIQDISFNKQAFGKVTNTLIGPRAVYSQLCGQTAKELYLEKDQFASLTPVKVNRLEGHFPQIQSC